MADGWPLICWLISALSGLDSDDYVRVAVCSDVVYDCLERE